MLALVRQLAATGTASAWLLERDDCYPEAATLRAELDAIADAAGVSRA